MRVERWENGELVEVTEVDAPDVAPTADERVAALEAKFAAVEALATKANATAQEVAQAAKSARPAST